MRGEKENQEISLVGRMITLEVVVLVMGVACLVYGLINISMPHLLIALIVLVVTVVLARVWRQVKMK